MFIIENLASHKCPLSASDNDSAEPFSTCYMLNTLVIEYCFMHCDAQVLCISNSNLSTLTLDTFQEHIVLSTPNLTSLTIRDGFHFTLLQLSSTCDLSLLKEADIETRVDIHYSVIITWLRLMTNVKMLTISSATLKAILNVSYFNLFSHIMSCLHSFISLKCLFNSL